MCKLPTKSPLKEQDDSKVEKHKMEQHTTYDLKAPQIIQEFYYDDTILKIISNIDKENDLVSKNDIDRCKLMLKMGAKEHAFKTQKYGYGRMYEHTKKVGCFSFQQLNKKILNHVLDNNVNECDIENCAPTILYQLCTKYLRCETKLRPLKAYIANRDFLLKNIEKAYNVTKKEAKDLMLIVTFGGTFETWVAKYKQESKSPSTFIKEYMALMKYVAVNAENHFPSYHIAQKAHIESQKGKEKKSNPEFGALSLYIQEIEKKMNVIMFNVLQNRNQIVRATKFDAIYFERQNNNDNNFDIIMMNEIKRVLDFDVKIKQEHLKLEERDNEFHIALKEYVPNHIALHVKHNDRFGGKRFAKVFLEMNDDNVLMTNSGLYIYCREKGLWMNDDEDIKRMVYEKSSQYFYQMCESESKWDLKKCYGDLKDALPAFCTKIKEFDFSKQIGYLLFKNGVLDLKNHKMVEANPDFYFTSIIDREYVCDDKSEIAKIVKYKLFDLPYNNEEKVNYALATIARGIAGHYCDRVLPTILGKTKSGKGTLTDLLRNALGDKKGFYGTLNGGNIIRKTNVQNEEETQWKWAKAFHDKRLTVCNEIPMVKETHQGAGSRKSYNECVKINAHTIRTLISGGDEINARDLYKSQVSFFNRSTIIIFSNDIPEFSDNDKSIPDRVRVFRQTRHSNPECEMVNEEFFPNDPNIKNWIKEQCVCDAFIYLVCEYYKNNWERAPSVPQVISDETMHVINEETRGLAWVKQHFNVYTDSDTDEDGNSYETLEHKKYGDFKNLLVYHPTKKNKFVLNISDKAKKKEFIEEWCTYFNTLFTTYFNDKNTTTVSKENFTIELSEQGYKSIEVKENKT